MESYFKKMQLVQCHLLKTSSDEDVKRLYEAREMREKGLCKPASPNPATRGQWQPTVELTWQLSNVKFQQMMKGAHSEHHKSSLGSRVRPQQIKSGIWS